MSKIPSRFYAIDEDGFARITISREYLGPETELLNHFAGRTARVVTDFIDHHSLAISQTCLSLARELPELRLATYFRPMTEVDGSVSLIPVWVKPGTEMAFMWKTPETMRIFFILTWDVALNRSLRGVAPRAYLVALNRTSKKTYLLPLPNLYDDGRICLGSANPLRGVGDIREQMNAALKIFQESSWNADLITTNATRVDAVRFLFRFNADGGQLPPLRDWVELSKQINNTNYQFIALL